MRHASFLARGAFRVIGVCLATLGAWSLAELHATTGTAMAFSAEAPQAGAFTQAPLRNRIRVELRASVSDVWALVGDLARLPEYTSGLERVETRTDLRGALTEYVCHFRPREEGGVGIVHREVIRWYEPNRGYASSGEEGNVFGVTNDLNLVTVAPSKEGTIMTWDEYYDAADLPTMRAEFDDAFADAAERLIARFGGRVIERFIDGPR